MSIVFFTQKSDGFHKYDFFSPFELREETKLVLGEVNCPLANGKVIYELVAFMLYLTELLSLYQNIPLCYTKNCNYLLCFFQFFFAGP